MGGWKYIDYQQGKAKQRLRKTEASLQDFRDLKRKGQIRREDREGFERKMDQVGDRRDAERKALKQALEQRSEADARRSLLGERED